MLSPVQITPPVLDAVTLDEAKLHLRVDGDDENTFIEAIIAAAVGHLDGYTGILGRCLMPQEWSQEFEVAYGDLVLPLGPVSSATIDGFTDFTVKKDGRGSFLRLNSGAVWPDAPLTVDFVAGSDDIPPSIKSAILLHIGTLYQFRETMAEKVAPTMAYEALIAPYRVLAV